jgi:pimeloyl-ACP methyl ester carboxylesterase
MLAQIQKAITLSLLSLAAAWLLVFWGDSVVLAVAGSLVISLSYSMVLGAQFVALRFVRQHDLEESPKAMTLCHAWLREVVNAARVFFWRQPFRWDAWPDRPVMDAALAPRRGIVFVHGFLCNRGLWNPWLEQLQENGDGFVAVSLKPVVASIDDYIPQLEAAVKKMTEGTGKAPILVCHSMGGLVARAWLRAHGQGHRAHHIITLGTPHSGTWLARFSHTISGLQMQQSSQWLEQLERDEPPGRRRLFTCFYSDCDNIVFPVANATLSGSRNRLVPGVGHLTLAFEQAVMEDVFFMLQQ